MYRYTDDTDIKVRYKVRRTVFNPGFTIGMGLHNFHFFESGSYILYTYNLIVYIFLPIFATVTAWFRPSESTSYGLLAVEAYRDDRYQRLRGSCIHIDQSPWRSLAHSSSRYITVSPSLGGIPSLYLYLKAPQSGLA